MRQGSRDQVRVDLLADGVAAVLRLGLREDERAVVNTA
jgi:hypothetical protein